MHRRMKALLCCLLVLVTSCLPASPALAQPSGQIGQELPLLGYHISRGDAAHMAAARAAGARFVVVVFSWRDIEPIPGSLYWETPDAALRAAQYYGLQVVARLDRAPDWALVEDGPAPVSPDSYANFAARVAERYGERLAAVVLWNEPNLAAEWNGQRPDPAGYTALLAAAYPAVKAAAPHLAVALAGLAVTLGDGDNAVNDLAYLEELYRLGAARYFDVLAAHAYGFGSPPEAPPDEATLNFRRVELQRAVMENAGDAATPVWITEAGWRTSAPDPADEWQVVTPEQQADYSLRAVEQAAAWPWLERLAFWELDGAGDDGYRLWGAPGVDTPAYRALANAYGDRRSPPGLPQRSSIEITAPDVVIRLGDRDELHPHWVHLQPSASQDSPVWRGEFFVAARETGQALDIVLETMQVDQPANRIRINGREVGLLRPRPQPDRTSTWVTQRLSLPAGLLRPGANVLEVAASQRNPSQQLAWWRWENFQFRHVRLEAPVAAQDALLDWSRRPAPSGWGETVRLRVNPWADGSADVWLVGNRAGQLWRSTLRRDGTLTPATNVARSRPDLIFTDMLTTPQGELAATNTGLYLRAPAGAWDRVEGTPAAYAYAVREIGGVLYAAFEDRGVWAADNPAGPWRQHGLAGRTILTLVEWNGQPAAGSATDRGVFAYDGRRWIALPTLPPSAQGRAAAQFVPRLFTGSQGELLARSEGRILLWDQAAQRWARFGPERLQGDITTLVHCCGVGTLMGVTPGGLWRRERGGLQRGLWQPIEHRALDQLQVTDAIATNGVLLLAATNGLFVTDAAQPGDIVAAAGLLPTTVDLAVHPGDPTLWFAATPTGVQRSRDGGESWQAASPPWIVRDLAFRDDGRLFAALDTGLAWTETAGAPEPAWRLAEGMEGVTFFNALPLPWSETDGARRVWAGTWGNAIGASADGGATMASLPGDLDTLSVPAILYETSPLQAIVGTAEGLYRSSDDGATWAKMPGPLGAQTIYALLRAANGALIAGATNGLWVSYDFGATWDRAVGVPETTVVSLGALADSEGRALLWAGTEGAGLWLSRGATVWRAGGLAGRSVYQVISPPGATGWLAATDSGLYASDAPPVFQ